jgi:hypothetical protein
MMWWLLFCRFGLQAHEPTVFDMQFTANQVHMKGYLVHLIWTMDLGSKGHRIISFPGHRTTMLNHGGAMHVFLGTAGSSPENATSAYGAWNSTGSGETKCI